MVPLGKLKMYVMVIWILLVSLPQEIILPIIFYWVCVPVGSSCTSLVWMCSLARWFIGETSCLFIRHFLRSGFGAGWSSVGIKNFITRIGISSCDNGLLPLWGWRNLEWTWHHMDGLFSQGKVTCGCFKTGLFFLEIGQSEKAEAKLLDSMLLTHVWSPSLTRWSLNFYTCHTRSGIAKDKGLLVSTVWVILSTWWFSAFSMVTAVWWAFISDMKIFTLDARLHIVHPHVFHLDF